MTQKQAKKLKVDDRVRWKADGAEGVVRETHKLITSASIRGEAYADEQNDCAVRALSAVAELPYGAAHRYFDLEGRTPKKGTKMWMICKLFQGGSFANFNVLPIDISKTQTSRTVRDRYGMRTRYTRWQGPTLAEFARTHRTGRYYITTATHATALIDGVFHDDHNPARSRVEAAFKFEAR